MLNTFCCSGSCLRWNRRSFPGLSRRATEKESIQSHPATLSAHVVDLRNLVCVLGKLLLLNDLCIAQVLAASLSQLPVVMEGLVVLRMTRASRFSLLCSQRRS